MGTLARTSRRGPSFWRVLGVRLGLLLVHDRLEVAHQPDHVPHAEDARGESLGSEGLEPVHALAGPEEFDGDAGHGLHRQGGASAGVAVELGENQTVQGNALVEGARHVDGVASHQGVAHQEPAGRPRGLRHGGDLLHQLLVHGEAAGRVVDHGVEPLVAGALTSGGADRRRGPLAAVHGDADGGAELLELEYCGRALYVRRHQQRSAALALEVSRQLGRHRGLADALETEQQHRDDAVLVAGEARVHGTHELHELLLADGHEVLARGRAVHATLGVADAGLHALAQGALLDARQEALHHPEVDVRLEQRGTHVAQRLPEVLAAQLADAAQALAGRLESPGQGLEHGRGR
jgi:hypothetical protein